MRAQADAPVVVNIIMTMHEGELVRTTDGQWITKPPGRCLNGHPSLWPPECASTTSRCGPSASQRPQRHSGRVGEQLVDPPLHQRQRDRLA
jgi:hypothetical protein